MQPAIQQLRYEPFQFNSKMGRIEALYIGRKKGAPMQQVNYLRVIPGMGIVGDYHFDPTGNAKPENQMTLIESEVLEYLQNAPDIILHPAETRRNILTAGIRLDDLVDEEFKIGDVRLRGVMICEPCRHIASGAALKGLVHRGGLRAEILTPGTIYSDDVILRESKERCCPG
ncbi:MAG TPA: hypothetical protein VJZ27_02415 [Aggregatilineales bacterium]|nr:hypothetical protein [Aggregatilineales bacterium]